MAIVITSLDSLEKRYNVLEENIVSLRKSLQHWQIWEAEYEGFREEISRLGETPTFHQLVGVLNCVSLHACFQYLTKLNQEELSEDFGGSLFNEKGSSRVLLTGLILLIFIQQKSRPSLAAAKHDSVTKRKFSAYYQDV